MSKQSEAKERQMYSPNITPMVCSNCQHYKSKMTAVKGVFGGTYTEESDKRCGLGGFLVRKMGGCKEHKYCEA